jgi:hypothetical protein
MRLPWWGVICVMVAAYLLLLLFGHFGKSAIAPPMLYSAAIIIITVAMRWKLRGHMWFWVTMACLAALHIPLILFIPWTTKWIPALVVIPIGIADSYAMLWVVSVIGKFMEERKSTEKQAHSD